MGAAAPHGAPPPLQTPPRLIEMGIPALEKGEEQSNFELMCALVKNKI